MGAARISLLFFALALVGLVSWVDNESESEGLTVRYTIRSLPLEPESPVAWLIALTLTPQRLQGDHVSWKINSADFIHHGDGPCDLLWLDAQPRLMTPDGLWRIEHHDPENPSPVEFDELPPLQGRALCKGHRDHTMTYAVSGTPYNGPLPLFDGRVSSLTYQLIVADEEGEQDPDEGEDEPVEIDPINDPD